MSSKGLPIVISAPSGAGKSSIAALIQKKRPTAVPSISCTTRPPRGGEKNGVDYFFISMDEFKKRIETGDFLEWAVVHDHHYGTPLSSLRKQLEEGKDVLLTIDPQGALSVRRAHPEGIFIFVVPPTWEALLNRLKSRATDDSSSLQVRIKNAEKELTYLSHYDYLLVNDKLDEAVSQALAIIEAEHCRLTRINKKDIPILSMEKRGNSQ